ncbi:MAG TPA: Fur family transcriptional regulator [Gemmatimonadota bacterium]|nr:Fur family transcriptional regulator [Gemmatimonadota bacterium]
MTAAGTRADGVARFREYLREHNHPVTPQRLRVAEAVFGTHRHVTAEEIRRRLATEGDPVGKATVYRTLDLLRRAGMVLEHDFGEGVRRYEPRRTRPRHAHLVCTTCGKVIEFVTEDVERIVREVAALHDFEPTHHRMEVYGTCEECRAR